MRFQLHWNAEKSDGHTSPAGATLLHHRLQDVIVIEVNVRPLEQGRYEVEAPGFHHEAFEGCLGAICAAHALAAALEASGEVVQLHIPQT